MSYLEKTMAPNEVVYAQGRIHWMVFAPAAGWFVLAAVFLIFNMPSLIGALYPAQASLGTGTGGQLGSLVALVITKTGLVGTIICLAMAATSGLNALIFSKTAELALTSHRALSKFGLIRRHSTELRPDRVESIVVNQSIMGRIFNYGSIYIQGIGGSSMPIPFIADPLAFRASANQNQPAPQGGEYPYR